MYVCEEVPPTRPPAAMTAQTTPSLPWSGAGRSMQSATRQQCDALGVNTDVFDLFAVPGATLKSCVVGVDVMAAGSAAGAPIVAMYIVADGRSGEIGLRTRGEWRDMPSYRLLPRSASSPDAVSWECLRESEAHVIEWRRIGVVPDTASAPKVSRSALIWKFVRACVRACVRWQYERLYTFNEFLLPSCTKAVQCLESDNGSNSRVAG
jgi:hypothetical protein